MMPAAGATALGAASDRTPHKACRDQGSSVHAMRSHEIWERCLQIVSVGMGCRRLSSRCKNANGRLRARWLSFFCTGLGLYPGYFGLCSSTTFLARATCIASRSRHPPPRASGHIWVSWNKKIVFAALHTRYLSGISFAACLATLRRWLTEALEGIRLSRVRWARSSRSLRLPWTLRVWEWMLIRSSSCFA